MLQKSFIVGCKWPLPVSKKWNFSLTQTLWTAQPSVNIVRSSDHASPPLFLLTESRCTFVMVLWSAWTGEGRGKGREISYPMIHWNMDPPSSKIEKETSFFYVQDGDQQLLSCPRLWADKHNWKHFVSSLEKYETEKKTRNMLWARCVDAL